MRFWTERSNDTAATNNYGYGCNFWKDQRYEKLLHYAKPRAGGLMLINGDPLKDMTILTKPEENLALIMKDGKIYKNTIDVD